MNHIIAADGRSFMLAADAHNFSPHADNVDRAVATVPQMAEEGLDAVLVPQGIAARCASSLRDVGVVLRCDASTNVFDPSVPSTQIVNSALDGVHVGADALVVMSFMGAEHGPRTQAEIQKLSDEASHFAMPLIVESLPYSYAGVDDPGSQPENIAVAARFAEELGADMIKTRLTGTAEDSRIIRAVTVPVVALGGPRTESLSEYLTYLSRCLDAGASGVAVGRNIVDDPDPTAKVAAIAAIIHGGVGVDAAMATYRQK
ncbi:class I fructose-bisphosphate aldolase [Cutibacterium avidum]|uniref:class I fructose-bisphosphate aldolase n=1 Tax=Cutibacterium avidum TaxID=33010 RepID=UPI0018C8770C|nr:hypothetical protein [Cutibacterium avidum]